MATQGISGVGLAVVTGGALLAYAGFRGVNPVQALRDVASGSPAAILSKTANLSSIFSTTQNFTDRSGSGLATSSTSGLVQAAYSFRGDLYSQAKRWQAGYSDCSSFVGKSLRKIGVPYPGGSVTTSYLASPQWKKVSRADARAGDVACNTSHMVIFMSNSQGIGQQNTRRNVQMDSIDNLMSGTGSYTCLRYVGSAGSLGDASGTAGSLADALARQAAGLGG